MSNGESDPPRARRHPGAACGGIVRIVAFGFGFVRRRRRRLSKEGRESGVRRPAPRPAPFSGSRWIDRVQKCGDRF